ncbi:uncharacterized protein BO88DRAFT_204417 [Aspergillus vadensis CBS 113365]|uniref:Uncharacterized protein n=1 Tax=Aspergillus vadensis (strain CBS 113365 / IMI 142717 / IBT 24658) TaxID=1448311 RepID=A0A319BH98_ASPVC|nr:hypothetical protein BO88DRAFT_204417 [Aspergillus vadensis CBS 113365]PYH72007.1 hypothetical protein BO88DRAFT_204417 [Aspergillus vadensis CBS 113365]
MRIRGSGTLTRGGAPSRPSRVVPLIALEDDIIFMPEAETITELLRGIERSIHFLSPRPPVFFLV